MKSLFALLLILLLPATAIALEISGSWSTNYGNLTLARSGSGISGTYYDGDGKITGTLRGNKLTFTYRDSSDAGEGCFEFAGDGKSFAGTWHAQSGGSGEWNGERPGSVTATTRAISFSGNYTTTYGAMRLNQSGNRVTGTYNFSDSSILTGTVSGNKLTFTYTEPSASGAGEFILAEDGNSFTGKWHASGQTEWSEWTGTRTPAEDGVKWLVVFESPWEESLAETPYSFGEMLTAYFRRVPDVRVRVKTA